MLIPVTERSYLKKTTTYFWVFWATCHEFKMSDRLEVIRVSVSLAVQSEDGSLGRNRGTLHVLLLPS